MSPFSRPAQAQEKAASHWEAAFCVAGLDYSSSRAPVYS